MNNLRTKDNYLHARAQKCAQTIVQFCQVKSTATLPLPLPPLLSMMDGRTVLVLARGSWGPAGENPKYLPPPKPSHGNNEEKVSHSLHAYTNFNAWWDTSSVIVRLLALARVGASKGSRVQIPKGNLRGVPFWFVPSSTRWTLRHV